MSCPEERREYASFGCDVSTEEDIGVMTFVVLGKTFDFVWDRDRREWIPKGLVERAERSFWKGLCAGLVVGALMLGLAVLGMRL